MSLLLLGQVVVSMRAGKCSGCGAARMIFVNLDGRTQCAGCAAMKMGNGASRRSVRPVVEMAVVDLDAVSRSGFVVVRPTLAERLAVAQRWLEEAESTDESEAAAAEVDAVEREIEAEERAEFDDAQFGRDA